MRHVQHTLTPSVVHSHFHGLLLHHLRLTDYKRSVTAGQLADLLILMAATARTLSAVVRARFAFCHEVARRAVYAILPQPDELDQLVEVSVNLLHAIADFSRRDRRRTWLLAIDTHYDPYYGSRQTPHIRGGQKKQGTKYFHVTASAVLIHKRRRYTLGLIPITASTPVHRIVEPLLRQIHARGLKIRGVVLDSGFDSADTLLLLQRLGLSYCVPLRRCGNQSNRRNDCFDRPSGTRTTLTWKSEKTYRPVTTRVLVWQTRGEPRAKVYAFGGWGDRTAVAECRRAILARRRYRERFGIETSYRQKNQAQAWTTSTNVVYRFLLEVLSHALRQLWVRLTQAIASARRHRPNDWVAELPLQELLHWLADRLTELYPKERRIDLHDRPLPLDQIR